MISQDFTKYFDNVIEGYQITSCNIRNLAKVLYSANVYKIFGRPFTLDSQKEHNLEMYSKKQDQMSIDAIGSALR